MTTATNDINWPRRFGIIAVSGLLLAGFSLFMYVRFFSQEAQNRLSRSLQNWTGVNGTMEVYSDGKVVKRFLNVDKLTTGKGTDDGGVRPYVYAWGVDDKNLNHQKDSGEELVYFQVSIHTPYVFFQEGK